MPTIAKRLLFCVRSFTLANIFHFFVSPLFASLCWFVAGLYTNSVLQIVADRQTVHCGEEVCPPLPDLGHQAFPHLTFVSICDYWLYFCVASTILRFSPLFVSKSMSLVMLRRWAFLQGALFWMRGISVALTRQSVPQEGCVTTALGEPFIEGFYIMAGIHITCGDIMYSGHTAGITLCTLIWTHYSKGEEFSICCGEHRPFITPNLDAVGDPATCSLTSVIAWVIAFTGFFFIIATHFHYSNDVFIGCIITQFVFRVYHYYIKTVLELPGWWAKVFRWFEGFDKSLMEQLPAAGGSDARHPLLKHGYSNRDLETGSGTSPYAAAAASNNLDRNQHEAVAPLSGVAVAVFSEGPRKEKRDEQERESKFGEGGVLGVKPSKKAHPTPASQGSVQELQHSPAGGHDSGSRFEYRAMPDDEHDHPHSPVVVAGEVADQEVERKVMAQEEAHEARSGAKK